MLFISEAQTHRNNKNMSIPVTYCLVMLFTFGNGNLKKACNNRQPNQMRDIRYYV